MQILKQLMGYKDNLQSSDQNSSNMRSIESIERITSQMDNLDPDHAAKIASFAYLMGRVAHCDQNISSEEEAKMRLILAHDSSLETGTIQLIIDIAKIQTKVSGAVDDFLVASEFKKLANKKECEHLMHCLFAVAAADEEISSQEEASINQISSELGFTHDEFIQLRTSYNHLRSVIKGLN